VQRRSIPGGFRPEIRPERCCMADKEWMTYGQIAARLGVTPDAVRHRARKEAWPRQEGNNGKIRVLIDPELLPEIPARNRSESTPDSGRKSDMNGTIVQHDSAPDSDREIRRLEDHLQTLRDQLEQQRTDHSADLDRLHDELERARLDADRTRADLDRERQLSHSMFDQLKDMADRLDRLHREHATGQTELGRLRAELEQMRRPWWRRLFVT
jgi:DNA-binding transcriptional MerR regulator